MVLLGVADANYKFIMVDIGQPGSKSDGGIWESSVFGQGLENGKLPVSSQITYFHSIRYLFTM